MPQNEIMNFKVSSALKNIIGRELINDRYIAVFELVKNAYDANATNVIIKFENLKEPKKTKITISDDGYGMNRNDIVNKWLFVAYSEKKPRNQEFADYRNDLKRAAAGAKGVGRFSCDRLGSDLNVITKTKEEEFVNELSLNWDLFEKDDTEEFINIDVQYNSVPDSLSDGRVCGTDISIGSLREKWDRKSIQDLRKSLKRLINPDTDSESDLFKITIKAEEELINDVNAKSMDVVNGEIKNDIFEKLNLKTISVISTISPDGKEIKTVLNDRGNCVFTLKQKNLETPLLHNIKISLYFLNKPAKNNFTRIMGIRPVRYGSVFVYKNEFRIFPYGEPGEDFFDMDKRKTQGMRRYMGTREVMGRISILGNNDGFIETTSRDRGFIKTPALESLKKFYMEDVLKIIEKYTINIVNWGRPISPEGEDWADPATMSNKIISEFSSFNSDKKEKIISLEYNEKLFSPEREEKDSLIGSVKELERTVSEKDDKELNKLAKKVKEHIDDVLKQNINLNSEIEKKNERIFKAEKEKEAHEKQIFFLKSANNQSVENLLDAMHSIFTDSCTLSEKISQYLDCINGLEKCSNETKAHIFSEIKGMNVQISKIAELALSGNITFKKKYGNIKDFLEQYVKLDIIQPGLGYEFVFRADDSYECFFESSKIGIIVDNIISNSLKAHADKIKISFMNCEKSVKVSFLDNGLGLSSGVNVEQIFDYGFSTTKGKGFGIGLAHVKKIVNNMGGTVWAVDNPEGFELIMELSKK